MNNVTALSSEGAAGKPPRVALLRRLRDGYGNSPLSVRNISLVYVWALLFLVFSLWVPSTFLTATTWKSLAAEQAVTTILALAVVISLSSGVFDLSVGAVLGAAAVFVAHFMVSNGVAPIPASLLTLVGAAVVGTVSATAVVVFRINSFIATLGISSILSALIVAISGNQQIIGLPESFVSWTTFQLFGIQGSFWIALGLALVIWFFLEHRPIGRHMYATGASPDSARLAGVRTDQIVFGTMICTALIAGIAGIVVTSRLGTGSPTIGPPYLLPAFAAAFLGSTQVKPGRFNVLGTLIAVYALATSVKGLQLAGAPIWLPELFNGAALLVAVAVSVRRRRVRVSIAPEGAPTQVEMPLTLRQAARDSVEALRDRTGETVSVIKFSKKGEDAKIVEAAESDAKLRVAARLGEVVPAGDLIGFADGDPAGPKQFEVIERDGVFEARALVTDRNGPAGLLSVRAPAERLSHATRVDIEEGVRDTAQAVSGRLQVDAAKGS